MEQMFEPVLEKNETVKKVIKPNKVKYWWSVQIAVLLSTVFTLPLSFVCGISETSGAYNWDIVFLVMGCILAAGIVAALIIWLFAGLYYKNVYYAFTNKRVVIRSGIFGIDYKSLEYKNLTATIVKVTLLDKLVRKNTGSIIFGSPSSPVGMVNANGISTNPYSYKNIEKPYELLKEVKEVIDTVDK
ncbi:MAG: PH domain-containing protein [Firmicutes bacterium]|nr:PH domain-containing protein [Bacillota bacterium]